MIQMEGWSLIAALYQRKDGLFYLASAINEVNPPAESSLWIPYYTFWLVLLADVH